MQGRCERHNFDRAVDRCGRCGGEFCQGCVVYPFGPRKPPFCKSCAIAAGGMRAKAGHGPRMSWRRRKAFERERAATIAVAGPVASPALQASAPGEEGRFDMGYFDAAPSEH